MEDIRFSTEAKNSEKRRIEPLKVIFHENGYSPQEPVKDRFRVLLIEKGSGICEIDGVIQPWVSPCLICLNESRRFVSSLPDTYALYFHPAAIHKKLTMENIREKGTDAPPEVIENRLLLRAFIKEPAVLLNQISPESEVRVRELLGSIRHELEEQETGWWPCRSRSYLAELLFLIAQLQDTAKQNILCGEPGLIPSGNETNISPEFKSVLDFIMRFYNTKISLDDIAREFGTNRTSLNKRFRAETGMTAISYLIDLRLRIASVMLINTDLSVAEITERVGIGDVSHFERLFRQKYRMTPRNYRAAVKGVRNAVTACHIQ